MAVRRALLTTALAALLILAEGEALAAKISCLECHRPHYRAIGSCVSCHGGDPRSNRLRIAHHDLVQARYAWFAVAGAAPVERGRKLIEAFACRRCHTTAGKGNKLASNLDRLPAGTTARNIHDAINSPALMMPRFFFDERQGTDLVNAILAGAREAARGRGGEPGESPQVVHFQREQADRENLFEKRCGACHRLLSRTCGGLGRGSVGPNLSGLLAGHYPKTAPGDTAWNAATLEKWLENPRRSREYTQMRPVPLPKGELAKLLALLEERQSHPAR